MTVASPLDGAGSLVSYLIKADGAAIDSSYQVLSIDTWVATNKVPRAQIVLFDGSPSERNFPISALATFLPGAKIEIAAGYEGKSKTIFKGVIVKQGIEIVGTAGSKLVIDLADPAIKMTLGRKSEVFTSITDGDLIGKLIAASGLEKDVQATAVEHEEVVQFYSSDWDLMLIRAEASGFVVTVSGGKVTVKPPDTAQAPVLRVEYGESILDLQAEMDAAEQYPTDAFKSYAWDHATQALLTSGAASATMTEAGNVTSETLAKVFGVSSAPRLSGAPLSQAALDGWSSADLLRSRLAKIRGHVRFQGSALAEVGKTIELGGLGPRFNGALFIGGVHHGIRDGRWNTTVTFGLSPRPFAAEAPRIAAPGASGQLPPIQGLQTGIVKQVAKDKAEELRVLVTLPLLQDEKGVWARLGTFYASSGFGALFYPEIGDEVILGFMNEDPRYPVILGSVYSKGRAGAFEPDEKNTKKAIVTREKLQITFDDQDKIIAVLTPGGHAITLDDKAGSITVTDSNKNSVSLSKQGVTVESASNLTLTAKGDIAINAGGNLALTAKLNASMEGLEVAHKAQTKFSAEGTAEAELTASGIVTIRGALVKLN